MTINKNFVVKNGFEVSTDLILANADTRRVGIASTNPQYTLDVAGGIGATDFYLTGIGTFANELNVGLDGSVLTVLGIGNSIGIGTALPQYLLDIRSPVSTGQTALYVQGDVRITGDLNIDDINLDDATIQDLTVTGITTVGFITASNLYVAGVGTFLSSGLKIRNVENTFQYSITGGAITANRTLNIPVITGTDTLATLGLSQTFSGTTNTFSGTLSASSTLSLTGSTTGIHSFGTNQTSGTLTFGGTSGTGTITLGRATTSQTTGIQTGVTASGNQKTINLGTGGASGSRTLITVGSATAGAISTVAINPGTNLILGLTTATPTGTTLQPLQVGSASSVQGAYVSGSVGIGTTNPGYLLDIRSPVSTGQTALYVQGDIRITGDIIGSASSINRLYVTGISTFVGFSTFNDSVIVEDNLRVGGISTFKNDVEFSGPSGITSVYWDNSENALKFLDNAYAFFGFDDDLKIYHDGSNSWIRDSGFGDLLIAGSLIKITNSNNTSSSIIADPDGKVELYYNNDKKIETVSTGATVYGTLQSQQLNVSGVSTFTNGSVLVGRATTTGTANQALQVESGAYFNGSVGIGVTNPEKPLHLSTSAATPLIIQRTTTNNSAAEYRNTTSSMFAGLISNATGWGVGATADLASDAQILITRTGGELLVGSISTTGTTSQKLQVTGGAYISGSVGIGTTTPTEKLDVNGNVKLTGSIYGPSELIIDPATVGDNTGSVRIKGDLYVDGTQTILNSTTIELADFNVGIATTVGTNALLDGAGIGIGSTGIRKTLTYANTPSDSLKSSENFDLASGKVYKINGTSVLSSTTLGSSIVNSSLTSVGTLTNLIVTGVTTSGGYNATTGNEYKINGTSVLTSTTLGSGVVNSSLTSVGTLGQLNVSGVSTLGVTTATNVTLQQLNVSGVSTLGVTTATNVTLQQLNVSGVSTLSTTTISSLNVSGVSTLGVTTATNVTLQQLNVSGVSTLGVTTISSLNVSGVSTLGVTTATNLTLQQLNVSGVSTFAGITTVTGTTLFSKQLNVSGVSTLGGNVSVAGSVFPSTDATYDLGSLSLRWRNVYTTDLQLSNEGSQNEVDNTWGKWTIQEGEENLFIINRRTGKKYKFLLEEVN
jgi:hypothetical protein